MGTILRLAALPLCGLALGAIIDPARASDADPQRPLAALTAQSGLPRAPEQLAVSFEHADLRFKVDPGRKWLDGDATLTFRALQPLRRLVVDLDPGYAIGAVSVDGVPLPGNAWSNPGGRMTVALPASIWRRPTVLPSSIALLFS